MDAQTLANFKKLIISNILSTDFGSHNKLVDKIKKRVDATYKLKENPDSDKLI